VNIFVSYILHTSVISLLLPYGPFDNRERKKERKKKRKKERNIVSSFPPLSRHIISFHITQHRISPTVYLCDVTEQNYVSENLVAVK